MFALLCTFPALLIVRPFLAAYSLLLLHLFGSQYMAQALVPHPHPKQLQNVIFVVSQIITVSNSQKCLDGLSAISYSTISFFQALPSTISLLEHVIKCWIQLEVLKLQSRWDIWMEYLNLLERCYKPPPGYLSHTMAQIAFMAKAGQTCAKFDISKAILLDSGCSQHTFFSKQYFTELKLYGTRDRVSNITGVGDTILQPIGVGIVTIMCEVNGEETPMILHNVLYCPQLKANLISCSQLLDYNVLISLRKKGCMIALDGQVVAQARHESGLFILNTWEDYEEAVQLYGMAAYGTSNSAVEQLWHRQMGHLGIQNLRKLQKMSLGLDLSHIKQVDCVCEACLKGRMHDIPHRNSLTINAKPYEVIFSDVEGPISKTGYDGSRYFVTFMDACTKESELYCLKYRSEVPSMFRQYKALKE